MERVLAEGGTTNLGPVELTVTQPSTNSTPGAAAGANAAASGSGGIVIDATDTPSNDVPRGTFRSLIPISNADIAELEDFLPRLPGESVDEYLSKFGYASFNLRPHVAYDPQSATTRVSSPFGDAIYLNDGYFANNPQGIPTVVCHGVCAQGVVGPPNSFRFPGGIGVLEEGVALRDTTARTTFRVATEGTALYLTGGLGLVSTTGLTGRALATGILRNATVEGLKYGVISEAYGYGIEGEELSINRFATKAVTAGGLYGTSSVLARWIAVPKSVATNAINPRLTSRLDAFRSYRANGGAMDMRRWVKATQGNSNYGTGFKSGFADWSRRVGKPVHGNSLAATGAHDVYVLRKAGTGRLLHFGETGRGYLTRFAEHQRDYARLGIDIEVDLLRTVDGKAAARSLETRYIDTFRGVFGRRPPNNPIHH